MGWGDILSFFNRWRKPGAQTVKITDLIDDVENLISENKVKFLENERQIARVRVFEERRVGQIKEGVGNEYLKRMFLREILSYRKRISNLDRIGLIYHQNIDIHLAVLDKLEDQYSAGMKSITHDQLNELVLDHEELLNEHRDVMATAGALIGNNQPLTDDLEDLHSLADELGVDIKDKK